MSEALETVRRWVERDIRALGEQREREIRLALQPKLRWLPERVWRWALRRLLMLEES